MMFWRDVHSDAPGGAWLGVEGVVSGPAPSRAHLHMQAADGQFMRLMAGAWPLVWARIAPDHYGYWYLRSELEPRAPDLILPPLTAAMARDTEGDPLSDKWYAAWSRTLLRYLETSPRSPLHSGRWWMAPCFAELHDDAGYRHTRSRWPGIPPASHLDLIPSQAAHDYTAWDFHDDAAPLALHPLSHDDDGRVKAWRRAAREGHLPPVLLMWITGLCRYVILDGHDRLLAAMLEGRAPPLLALLSVGESQRTLDVEKRNGITSEVAAQLSAARSVRPPRGRPFSIERANELLIEAFDDRPRLCLTTRAWPLKGGVRSWLDDVRSGLRRLAPTVHVHTEMEAAPSR